MKGKAIRYYIIAFCAVAILSIVYFMSPQVPHSQEGTGEVQIGGPFTLTNQRGQEVSDAQFRGKLMLVYFGYTFCPDICPADLLTMTSVLNALGDKAKDIAPVFITIDPERDTVEQLKTYMENFHSSIEALTGTPEAIAQAAQAYKVYYAKVDEPGMSSYLMDHSAFTYLMGRDGKYLTHFSHGTTAEKMAKKIRKYQ